MMVSIAHILLYLLVFSIFFVFIISKLKEFITIDIFTVDIFTSLQTFRMTIWNIKKFKNTISIFHN